MQQCSACCGAGLAPADERQHGAHCPPLLASPATRRRPQLRWQLRLPPQAIAASRAGRIYQRHRRRRAESPDAAKVSAGADFSPADIVGPSAAPSPVVAPVAPLPALPRKGLTGLAARIVFGVLLGVSGAIVILTGGWFYMAIACLVAYQASQEYFGFVTSKGISEGMQPPSPLATTLTTLSCIGLVVWTFVSHGAATSGLAVMSFAVLSLQLLGTEKPRFSQLTSSVFGMFYCGYLPSFWIKLRMLSAPAVNTVLARHYPVLLGGLSQWTVGLLATFLAVACIIAADVGAFVVGKAVGRTPLSEISPKKTVEGAAGGLLCSVTVALGFSRWAQWPLPPAAAVVLGVIIFFASLFGDLIESVMKREAGMKDASDLIPGHGGLLDRFDSYLFTGAMVFWFLHFVLPLYGL